MVRSVFWAEKEGRKEGGSWGNRCLSAPALGRVGRLQVNTLLESLASSTLGESVK